MAAISYSTCSSAYGGTTCTNYGFTGTVGSYDVGLEEVATYSSTQSKSAIKEEEVEEPEIKFDRLKDVNKAGSKTFMQIKRKSFASFLSIRPVRT